MGSNSSRIYNRTWGYGHSDPMNFAREFRIRRDQANMERALTDLSYIFVRIFLWATIYMPWHPRFRKSPSNGSQNTVSKENKLQGTDKHLRQRDHQQTIRNSSKWDRPWYNIRSHLISETDIRTTTATVTINAMEWMEWNSAKLPFISYAVSYTHLTLPTICRV